MSTDFGPKAIEFADNDPLWVARKPIGKLFELFRDCRKWVETENGDEKHVLKMPFVIYVQALPIRAEADGPDILVQGIDGTNLITVHAAPGADKILFDRLKSVDETSDDRAAEVMAAPPFSLDVQYLRLILNLLRPFPTLDAFKRSFYREPLQITVCQDETESGRAYIHFPIWRPDKVATPDPAERMLQKQFWLALFHLSAATDATFLDKVLANGDRSLPVKRFTVDRGGALRSAEPLPGRDIRFVARNETIPLLYLGSDTTDEEACEMLIAMYNRGEISYREAYCKPYAILP